MRSGTPLPPLGKGAAENTPHSPDVGIDTFSRGVLSE